MIAHYLRWIYCRGQHPRAVYFRLRVLPIPPAGLCTNNFCSPVPCKNTSRKTCDGSDDKVIRTTGGNSQIPNSDRLQLCDFSANKKTFIRWLEHAKFEQHFFHKKKRCQASCERSFALDLRSL